MQVQSFICSGIFVFPVHIQEFKPQIDIYPSDEGAEFQRQHHIQASDAGAEL
jgi:hypothetical protein